MAQSKLDRRLCRIRIFTISSYRSVSQTARFMRVPSTTMLFLSAKMKAEHRNMPPCEALSAALSSRTHRAATSGIRSDFWQESQRIPCIYLKPPLIYCPMPLMKELSARNCGKRFTQSVWQQELNSHPKSVRIGHTF